MLATSPGLSRHRGGCPLMCENISETKTQPQPESRRRGDGSIFQRGQTWWIRYSFRGKAKRESSGSTDPAVALKKLDKRIRQVRNDKDGLQTFIPKADRVLVSALLDALVRDWERKKRRSIK